MRLLVLAPQPFYVERGTPIAVDLLVRTLAEQGHAVELLAFHLGTSPRYPNVTVHRIPRVPFVRAVGAGLSARKLLCDALFVPAALRLVASGRFDAVHAVEEAVFVAMAARRLFGLPYVYDMDSSLSDQVVQKAPLLRPTAPLMRALERAAIRGSAAVAPVCDALAARASAAGARRVVLLRDVSLLSPDAASRGPAAGTPARAEVGGERAGGTPATVVMYVGNLERYQGIDLLLEGFARAARRDPSLVLAVVGGAPADVARYGGAAERLGLEGRARFLGPRPVARLAEYLAAADVLVSPRVAGDNTPMKVYSYLHAGRPLVATDLPTHTQVLTPEVALLVPPDPDWLAGALVRLARDPALRARLSAAGRRLVEARHSLPAFAAQVAALYPPAAAPAPAARASA